MNRRYIQITRMIALLIILCSSGLAAQDFPEKPQPPRLVNDFAGMLNDRQIMSLEDKLVAFNDSTSTQIAIVIVDDLKGYDKADYAQRLAEQWGIGQKGLSNGILILVKAKTSSSPRGEVFIATGYGMEGIIPDLVCDQIVDKEILPSFRRGEFYEGLDKATNTLMALARGEFPADQYKPEGGDISGYIWFIIVVIFIIIVIFARGKGGNNQRHISNKGLPLWILLSMMNSGSSKHRGSWGGFSGGGGSGRGGGGFGGFGGGSFGGGGAGGSW
ncbi:MAG: TPM domain-containing protein [Bacteroidales bacterium]|nr:TPM domain-containing protein [Bacteroidales bacterium]